MKEIRIALIPAYEPEDKLIKLVKELDSNVFEIVVIDDGSGINYKDIFDECKSYADVISYEDNKGKGYALKTGLKYIKDKYRDNYIVVTMDCDGQHIVKDAKKLIKEVVVDKKTLVTGKRLRGEKTPLRSKIGNSITRFVYRVTTGLDIYDTQTGLRAFSDELVDFMIDIDGDRYEYEMNVLLKCASRKIRIKEVEISTIYIDNNSGSHFKTVRDSLSVYKVIFKFLFSK